MYQGRFSAVLRLKGSFSVQSCTVSTCPPELTNHSDAQHKPGTVVQQAKRKDFRLISLWMIYCLLQSTWKEIWNHSDSGFIPSKSYIYFVTRTAHRATWSFSHWILVLYRAVPVYYMINYLSRKVTCLAKVSILRTWCQSLPTIAWLPKATPSFFCYSAMLPWTIGMLFSNPKYKELNCINIWIVLVMNARKPIETLKKDHQSVLGVGKTEPDPKESKVISAI